MATVRITVDYGHGQVEVTREGPGIGPHGNDVGEVPRLLMDAAQAVARSLDFELRDGV